MSANSPAVTWPPAAAGAWLRSPLGVMLLAALLGVVLQWVIAWVYGGLVVELFSGARATGLIRSGLWIRIAYLMTALTSAACALYCATRSGPSRVIVLIQLVGVIIPLQALVAARFELARPEFATAVGIAYLGTLVLAGLLPEMRLPPASRGVRAAVLVVALLLTMYVLWALLARGGLARLSFDLRSVYEVREDYITQLAPFIAYLVPWQGLVLTPALILIAMRRRSLLMALIGVALQLMLFGMTGFRAFLLIPALLVVFYSLGPRRQLTTTALAGMLAVVAIALVLYAWFDEPLIPLLLIDRVIVVPAEVHYWYYDFFGVQGHAHLQLAQSVLRAVSPSHYSDSIAEVIGWTYLGADESANVGLFGDAYANFGFAGCGAFALLFVLVLKVVDAAGRETDPRVAAALVAAPAFSLVNSGLLTTLLSDGLGLTILVLWALATPPRPAHGTS